MCDIIIVAFVLIKVEQNICTCTNSNVNLYLVIDFGGKKRHWRVNEALEIKMSCILQNIYENIKFMQNYC